MPRKFDDGEAELIGFKLLSFLQADESGMASAYGALLAMAASIADRLPDSEIEKAEHWAERKNNGMLAFKRQSTKPS